MDAVEFIEERKRMCKSQSGCFNGCPAGAHGLCKFNIHNGFEADKQVEIVEEWSAAHPRKTRQDVFLEQWPEVRVESDGILSICPSVLSKAYRMYSGEKCPNTITPKICADCRREFWSQEVDE